MIFSRRYSLIYLRAKVNVSDLKWKTTMSKRRQFRRRKRNAPTNRPSPEAKHWVAALAALGNEQWAEAIDRFKKFMQGVDNPLERLPIYHNLDLGDHDLVERKARQLIGIINERPEGHFALGLVLLRQKQPAAALTSFLAAHALEPEYVPTLYNIGYCYMKTSQPEEAPIWLERALERDKTFTPARQRMGQVHLQ
jgi:tetratricopeptide (TPR) repeat protein